jgi:DNA-binding transcriptional LysR family regulator
MNPRLLTIFIAVCDAPSMTAAAKALYLSQPAVSAAIRDLERDLGVVLFERLNRRLTLTPAGAHLADVARHVLQLTAQARTDVMATHHASPLRIGSSITIGIKVLPELIARFQALNPKVEVTVTVHTTETITAMVAQNALDLGLVEGQVPPAPLVAMPFMRDDLVVIAPPDHPLSHSPSVELHAIGTQALLMRDTASGTRQLADAALLQHGHKVTPTWESISTQALVEAVKAGLGLSILPWRLVEDALKRGDVVRLNVPELRLARDFLAITHRDKYHSPSLTAFLKLING